MAHRYFVTLAISLFALNVIGCGPCGSGQELREEKYSNSQIKTRGCIEKDSENNYRKQGEWVTYYRNGQNKAAINYEDGKMDGKSIIWWENGQKRLVEIYEDGELDGLKIKWFENGQKEMEEPYEDSKLDGVKTVWFENGQKRSEATLENGELVPGTLMIWDKAGNQTK